MPKFCLSCEAALQRHVDVNITMRCTQCGQYFEGDDGDSLIMSKFTMNNAFMNDVQVEHAEYDRVNQRVDKPCPSCKYPNLIQVVTDYIQVYKCENCHKKFKGSSI